MPRSLHFAAFALLALGACASSTVRYIDPAGKEYAGAVDPATHSMTAHIAGKVYRGPFQVNEWGQAKSTLTSTDSEPLYCTFRYQGLKVKGACTDLAGGDYSMQSR